MHQTYEFLKSCGPFWVLTQNDNMPAGRPFGAVMEADGMLYICTARTKDVYRQITENPHIQLVALKGGTRDWLRLSARAAECSDPRMIQRMFAACPILEKRYAGPDDPLFALFRLDEVESWLHTDSGKEQLDG